MEIMEPIRSLGSIGRRATRRLSQVPLPDGERFLESLRELRRPRRKTDVRGLLLAGAAGALLAFFLDPDQGRRRRKVGLDRLLAAFRATGRRVGRLAGLVASDTRGMAQRIAHGDQDGEPLPNDATLAQRVQSEIFRDPDIPKGRINVNVEDGVVVLRGELDRPDQIKAMEEGAWRVAGVRGINNLLHLAINPPPDRWNLGTPAS
jgi:hypothetical protein